MVEAKTKYDVEQKSQQVWEKGTEAKADLGGRWHPFHLWIRGLPAAGQFHRTLLSSLLAVCDAYLTNFVSLAMFVTLKHLSFLFSEVKTLIISLFCLSLWGVKGIKPGKVDEILKWG